MEEKKLEQMRDQIGIVEEKSIFYYYKRWIWVQFPWCTIDVYSNLSSIMEISMGSHTNYISTYKENELVNGTIQILKEAKQRKKRNKKGDVNASSPNRQLSKSSSASQYQKMRYRSESPSMSKHQTSNNSSVNIMVRRIGPNNKSIMKTAIDKKN